MIFEEKSSFTRSFKKLSIDKQEQVISAIESLSHCFNSNIKPIGLGLKRLRGDVWEIRSSIKDRILFSISGGTAKLLLVGNHDEIQRYLKNQ